MSRPRLLDLFCGAGGCGVGYARAGFEVVGVTDPHDPRRRYWSVEEFSAISGVPVSTIR